MSNQTYVEALVSQFIKTMPKDMIQMKTDFEKQLKAALSAAFSKMDLVSREEFDIQSSLLQRTRERLEDLQKQIDILEQSAQHSEK